MTAAENAFIAGMCAAVVISAVLVPLAARDTWWRAPSRAEALAPEDVGTEGLDGQAAYALPLQPYPGSGGGTLLLRRWRPYPTGKVISSDHRQLQTDLPDACRGG